MIRNRVLCGFASFLACSAAARAAGTYVNNDLCSTQAPLGELTEDNAHQTSLPDGFSNDDPAVGTDGAPHSACVDDASDDQIYNDVWFRLFADFDGILSVSLQGSDFDTKLAVYEVAPSSCLATDANLVACNDDCGGQQTSGVTFTTVAGAQYLLRIGGQAGAKGTIFITFTRPGTFLADLTSEIQNAVTGGPANSLSKKVAAAQAQLDRGNLTPASNMLQAFINEVNSLQGNGTLSQAEADLLRSTANSFIDSTRC
jgi:hypothetical protein